MKKAKIWIWLAIVAVVVAAAVAVTVFLVNRNKVQTQTQTNTKLYWNVEKFIYSSADTTRTPRGDGNYYVRMATGGEQLDVPVADQLTVSFMDTMEVMGLQMDENGVVTDVLRVEELGYTIVVEDYYVESFSETEMTVNSMGTFGGLSRTFALNGTEVFGVDPDGGLLCGLPGVLQVGSKVTALADSDGNITHVYTEDPFVPEDIYWNTSRKYDSTLKMSTRELDEAGRFAYTFAINGEQVTLYTRDQKVANSIDSVAAKCMGLTFDEEGYISGTISTKKATGNSSFGSWYHVTDIQGNMVSAFKYASGSDNGTSVRGQLAPDCKIYDCSGTGAYIGEPTELRLYDQIHGLKNPYGQVIIIFVVNRTHEADIYYNVSRQWDSNAQSTKRTPNADGWYEVKLAKDGEQVTLRTKDKALVDAIDKLAVRCFGLDVEGDEIKAVYSASSVWGGRQFCSYDVVTDITDGVVTAEEQDASKQPATYVGPMAPDCKVYDCTGNGAFVGVQTQLQLNDKIHALKDLDGNITYIFVVERPVYADIYWNVSRQWDSNTQSTKRTPNADGYYEIVLAIGGEQKTFRTKDISIINAMDKIGTKCFGLYTDGDIVTKVMATSKVYGGAQFCSWDIVTKINGNTVTAKEADASKGNLTYTEYMSRNCQVLDCSGTGSFIGEKTELRVGDKIHALQRTVGGITYIFVVERSFDTPVYWNVDKYSVSGGVSARPVSDDGFWYITLAVGGEQKVFKTDDQAIVNAIDGTAVMCFGMEADGDVITKVIKHTNLKNGQQFCSWDTVTDITDGVVTAEEQDTSKQPAAYVGKMIDGCEVYDVSGESAFEGAATELRVGDTIHALKNADGEVTVIYVITRIKQIKTEEAYCDTCAKTVTWYSWDGVVELEHDHYFLDEDITVSQTAFIGSATDSSKTLCMDLRDKTITGSVRVFRVYGTLNITANEGGTVNSTSGSQAAVFYVYKNATLNLYGGTLTGTSKSTTGGGTGAVDNGTLNVYGGAITGGSSAGSGGNIIMFNSATVNLYDGTIANGSAKGNGGNISMSAGSALNIYGGFVTGGTATGSGACINGIGTVSLYGGKTVVIDQLRLGSDKTVAIDGVLGAGSSIGIVLADGTGTVTGTTDEANKDFFVPADSAYRLVYTGGKLVLETVPVTHTHCVCGGSANHGTCADVTFEAWPGYDNLSLTSGTYSYCLTGHISLDGMLEIPAGVTLNLCLNGNDITGSDRVFQINGTLNLSDCKGTGTVTTTKVRQAPIFYVRDGGCFNMYGGILKGTKTMASDGGLGVIGLNADGGAKMNLYGGTVTGGATSKNGGNILLYHDSVLNIYGGTVTAGNSASGGNIQIGNAKAVVNLYGGTISAGTSSGAGGNIRISSGTLNVYGGSITGGTTTNGNGGSIFVTGSNSVMNMYGGTVSGGYAGSGSNSRHGGNIYVASGSTLKIEDDTAIAGVPTVSGGTTEENNGGNIYFGGKSLSVNGASITGGTAPGNGDDIYISTAGAVFGGIVTCGDVYVNTNITVDTTALDPASEMKFTYA